MSSVQAEKLQLKLQSSTQVKPLYKEPEFAAEQALFLRNGRETCIVRDATLEIISTENGDRLTEHSFSNFGRSQGARGSFITCVEEIKYKKFNFLAVVTEFAVNDVSSSVISIYTRNKLLGSMDFCEKITCCRYIPEPACQRSALRNFRGTLAVGTESGKLFLIDLMIPSEWKDILHTRNYTSEIFQCNNISTETSMEQIEATHRHQTSSKEKSFFSIQLEILVDSTAVQSILCMPNLFMMTVGLADGRMVLYSLENLKPFHVAFGPKAPHQAPLAHMSFLEPTDDPRSAVYIWAFHWSNEGAIAVMHSLMFSSKTNQFYEGFQSCSVRLTMPVFEPKTTPICCRSIMRQFKKDDEDVLTLNVFAWTSADTKRTNIMIFDLNQWYKNEMPGFGDWRRKLQYVAVFELLDCVSLDVIIDDQTLIPFESILRPEEHFHPNSLGFVVGVLESAKFSTFVWEGLQKTTLNQFNTIGPQMILEPSYHFNEMLQAAILPQLVDGVYTLLTPVDEKRDFLLTVALEYNYTSFLYKCASAWADGSYLGKDSSGVGLSRLTDWIVSRARAIKKVCNTLSQPLFDFSKRQIDYGTQKQLWQCSKQLKVLSDLYVVVLKKHRRFIPDHIFGDLESQCDEIKMASDYQEVLQWLLNVGMLPEGEYEDDSMDALDFHIVPFPYEMIKKKYDLQRLKLSDERSVDPSKFLFIDAFIERECNPEKLYKTWGSNYPPSSLQALLRTLLVPGIATTNKRIIFQYLFMDITTALDNGNYSTIVRNLIKFPAVFSMSPATIKQTQAFWCLDNGKLATAVEEHLSPLCHDQQIPKWQRELLIGTLLKQNEGKLALRALQSPGRIISLELEMLTLLANNRIRDALLVQRSSHNPELLVKFFEKVVESPYYEQLLTLDMTDDEGKVMTKFLDPLKHTGQLNHLNLHFVFLLNRRKFIDAARLVESLENDSQLNIEPMRRTLNMHYKNMDPISQQIVTMVLSGELNLHDMKPKECPQPLSAALIGSRFNSAKDFLKTTIRATVECYNEDINGDWEKLPFIGPPKLGIFEYKQPSVNHHDVAASNVINEHGKRMNEKSEQTIRISDFEETHPKKRKLTDTKRLDYATTPLRNITRFRETKPNYNFVKRSANNSTCATPERRVQPFGDFLSTPVVQKKTPPSRILDKCPTTPHSILKTKSCRGSVSPAPSRFSEFNDDNKSVKSITFALPDSQDTSFNDSFIEEEPNNEQLESSADLFFSPEKLPETKTALTYLEGPKPRKPLPNRSITPVHQEAQSSEPEVRDVQQEIRGIESKILANIQEIQVTTQDILTSVREMQEEETAEESEDDAKPQSPERQRELSENESSSSSNSGSPARPFVRKSVLRSSDDDYDSDSTDVSIPDRSIFHYQRKSVLTSSFENYIDSDEDEKPEKVEMKPDDSDDSEMVEDEHFEEEELPDHSDYDDSGSSENKDEYNYGDLDLADSDESESRDAPVKQSKSGSDNEVICLDSSSEDEPAALPAFVGLSSAKKSIHAEFVPPTHDEVLSHRYEQQDEQQDEQEEMEIESPPFEIIESATESTSEVVTVAVFEQPPDDQQEIEFVKKVQDITQDVPLDLVKEKVEVAIEVEEPITSTTETIFAQPEAVPTSSHDVTFSTPEARTVITKELSPVANKSIQSEEDSFLSADGELNEGPNVMSPNVAFYSTIEDAFSETTNVFEKGEINEVDLEEADDSVALENKTVVPADLGEATNVFEKGEINEGDLEEVDESVVMENETVDRADFSEATNVFEKGEIDEADLEEIDDSVALENETVVPADLGEATNVFEKGEIIEADLEEAEESVVMEDETPIPADRRSSGHNSMLDREVEEINEQLGERKENAARIVSPEVTHEELEKMRKKLFRSRSVPVEVKVPPPPRRRAKRAATEDRENPKNLLKVKSIVQIETSATPSPGVLTRSKSQLLEHSPQVASQQEAPTTSRVTRRSTTPSRLTPLPLTPRRATRATSKEKLVPSQSFQEERITRGSSKEKITRGTSKEKLVKSQSFQEERVTRGISKDKTVRSQSSYEELPVGHERVTRKRQRLMEQEQVASKSAEKVAPKTKLRAATPQHSGNPQLSTILEETHVDASIVKTTSRTRKASTKKN